MISLKDKEYTEIEVIEVNDIGLHPTFDIEVPDVHHYITKSNVVTHNTSIFANIVSGGLEPVFLPEYIRTVIENSIPEDIREQTPKYYEGEFKETALFKFTKEGDEQILRGVHNGQVYKIDKNRGLTKEVLCEDYGVRYLKNINQWNSKAEWASTTATLTTDDHVRDLIGFSKWLDSACSKCMDIETTMVVIDGKVKYLDELPYNKEIDTFTEYYGNIETHNNKLSDVLSIYNNGPEECIKITFNDGSFITSTFNHRIYTENGWKKAVDINIGDKINRFSINKISEDAKSNEKTYRHNTSNKEK